MHQISNFSPFTVEAFMFSALFPAFFEEFIFRFLSYSGVKILFAKIISFFEGKIIALKKGRQTYFKVKMSKAIKSLLNSFSRFYISFYIKDNKIIKTIWVFVTATLFSFAHLPNTTNLYIYFILGSIYSLVFFKFGLLGSISAHAFYNYISTGTHGIVLTTLKYLGI